VWREALQSNAADCRRNPYPSSFEGLRLYRAQTLLLPHLITHADLFLSKRNSQMILENLKGEIPNQSEYQESPDKCRQYLAGRLAHFVTLAAAAGARSIRTSGRAFGAENLR
jgi:hypothetical protein